MNDEVLGQTRNAMRWRALQLGGVQAVYFLRLLILAKLLAPEDFGLLAIGTIAITVLLTLSNFGMVEALVQRPDASREQHDGAWTVNLLRAIAVAAVLFLAAPWVAVMFGEPQAAPIIQVLALRPVIEAASSIGIARLTRELRFRPLAIIYFAGAVVDLVVAIATAGLLGVWALVAGALAGTAVTAALSYAFAPHRPRLSFRWREIAPLANYGRWILATGVVGLAGTLLTQLAVSRQLGAAALGLYFLALRLAFLPSNAASAVVGSVAFPMFVRLRDDVAATGRAFADLLGALNLLLIPTYCVLLVVAPLLEQALGPQWAGTAPVVQVMCVAGITGILGELLGPLLMGRGEAHRAFRLETVQTGVLLLSLLPAIAWLGVTGGALAWLVGNTAAMFLGLWMARRTVPGAVAEASRRSAAAIGAGVAAAAAAYLVVPHVHGLAGVAAAGGLGVAVTLVVLAILDRVAGLDLQAVVALVVRRGA